MSEVIIRRSADVVAIVNHAVLMKVKPSDRRFFLVCSAPPEMFLALETSLHLDASVRLCLAL